MMLNWIKYLLEANLYLTLLYAVYYMTLRRETFYQVNRAYLLTACVVAFIIPLTQISRLRPAPVLTPVDDVESVIINPVLVQRLPVAPVHSWTADDCYILVYAVVAAVMLVIFSTKFIKLIKLSRKAKKANGLHVVEIDEDNNAFSFFSYLFIGSKLSASTIILKHELVHIRQKHSLDIIFLELFKIFNWFNPIVYLLQNSMKELHEFIADRETAQQEDVNQYTDFLVNNAYGFAPNAITNNFFNKNLLKTRIMMLHQKRSGSLARLKLLVVLPLLTGMVCLSTLAFTKDYAVIDLAPTPPALIKDKPSKTAGKNKLMFIIDPANYTYNDIAKISKKLTDNGYVLSYSEKDKGTDLAMLGFAIKIANEAKHTGAGAEFRVADLIKGGYVIELGVNDNNVVRVHSKAKPGAKIDKNVILPPTFPVPVKKPAQVTPPSPPSPPPAPGKPVTAPNPPTSMTFNGDEFSDLYKQLAKGIRYPAIARENNVQGRVMVTFNVDANHHATNIGVLRWLTNDITQEVVRALKNCTMPNAARQNINYVIPLSFAVVDKSTGKYVDGKARSNSVEDDPHIEHQSTGFKSENLAEVVIVTYKEKADLKGAIKLPKPINRTEIKAKFTDNWSNLMIGKTEDTTQKRIKRC